MFSSATWFRLWGLTHLTLPGEINAQIQSPPFFVNMAGPFAGPGWGDQAHTHTPNTGVSWR